MSDRRVGNAALLVALVVAVAAVFVRPVPTLAQEASGAAAWSGSAGGRGVTFALSASVGALEGTAWERVYAYPLGERFKVSELTWDMKHVALAGVRGSVVFADRYRLDVGYSEAVSEGEGRMMDRDWRILAANRDDLWTDQSLHPDTSLDKGSIFDANLAVATFSRGAVTLSGVLGYKKDFWRWSSRGGTYVYSTFTADGYLVGYRSERGAFPPNLEVIEYEQEYRVPYLGLAMDGTWGSFRMQGHFRYSPWVSGSDLDHHPLRDLVFEADFSNGQFFGFGLEGTYFFNERIYATLGLGYQQMAEMVGDAIVTERAPDGSVTRMRYPDSAALEMNATTAAVGVGIRF